MKDTGIRCGKLTWLYICEKMGSVTDHRYDPTE